MKRKQLSVSTYFPAVTVYLNDIKEIIAILEQYPGEIEIEDEKHKYVSLEELISQRGGHKLESLSIGIYRPHVFVDLKKSILVGSSLHADGNNDTDEGTYLRLKELLKKKTRPASRILNYYSGLVLFFLLVVGSAVIYWLLSYLAILAYASSISVLMLVAFYFGSGAATRIWLKNKENLPGFISRNKDQLVLNILCALIGAIISAVLSVLATAILLCP